MGRTLSTAPDFAAVIFSAFAMRLARISDDATATVAVTVEFSDATGRSNKTPAIRTRTAHKTTTPPISSIFDLLNPATTGDGAGTAGLGGGATGVEAHDGFSAGVSTGSGVVAGCGAGVLLTVGAKKVESRSMEPELDPWSDGFSTAGGAYSC